MNVVKQRMGKLVEEKGQLAAECAELKGAAAHFSRVMIVR